MQGGGRCRLHRHHLGKAFNGGRYPGHQAPAAHCHQHGIHAAQLFQEFRADSAGTGGNLGLVVGVAVHGPGFGRVRDRGVVGDGVFGTALDDGRPGFPEFLHLHGRGGLGDKDRGRHACLCCGIGVGEAGIPAGGDDDSNVLFELAPLAAGQHAVERTPGLERTRVLHELAFEPDSPGEALPVRFDHRGAADQPGDPVCGFIDVVACDHVIPGLQ
ncbi:hypothetical protein D9M72_424150 [compost metagenome]